MAEHETAVEDHAVVEMLMELVEDIYDEDRLLNVQDANNWNIWEHHLVTLTPKPMKDDTTISILTPTSVSPVMYTWYSRCIGLLCREEMTDILWHQFAFTPRRQVEEVLFTITHMIEETQE